LTLEESRQSRVSFSTIIKASIYSMLFFDSFFCDQCMNHNIDTNMCHLHNITLKAYYCLNGRHLFHRQSFHRQYTSPTVISRDTLFIALIIGFRWNLCRWNVLSAKWLSMKWTGPLFVRWQFGLQLIYTLLQWHLLVEHFFFTVATTLFSSPVPCSLSTKHPFPEYRLARYILHQPFPSQHLGNGTMPDKNPYVYDLGAF